MRDTTFDALTPMEAARLTEILRSGWEDTKAAARERWQYVAADLALLTWEINRMTAGHPTSTRTTSDYRF